MQAPTVNVHVVEHSYSELANLLDMAAYNLALVDRSKPQATWKDDPNFMAVLLWWWTPEPTLEKWKYAGDQWKVSRLRNMNEGGGAMGSSILECTYVLCAVKRDRMNDSNI